MNEILKTFADLSNISASGQTSIIINDSSFLLTLEVVTVYAAELIGFIGVSIMCFGAFKGLFMFTSCVHRRMDRMTEIRIDIAKHLSLGLEFLVGKDIIETVITPTFGQLTLLCFLILIRTAISYILSWELKEAVEEIEEEEEFKEALDKYKKSNTRRRNNINK